MRRFDQINVIPFIDIMLVLLAIVLTTASFIAQGKIPINLPLADAARPIEQPDRSLEIVVDKDGTAYLDGKVVHKQALANRLSDYPSNTPVVLRVDQAAQFGAFVSVVDALKHQRMDNLAIVTRQTK